MKTIEINSRDVIELERTSHLLNSYNAIISYLTNSNKLDNLSQFTDDYTKYFKQYELQKKALQQKYLDNINVKAWNLDFRTGILTYYE